MSSTRLHIRQASAEELAGWDALVRRFSNHRVVHTLAWLRSLERSGFGHAHFLVFERDSDIVGCLPGLVADMGPLRLFGSPPPASQTVSMGPVFDGQRVSTPEIIETLIPYLERNLGIHHMEIMSPDVDPGAMLAQGFRGEPWPTYRAKLYPGDEKRALKGLKDSARRNVARGKKLGLEVRFEQDDRFAYEHYSQLAEVYLRRGHAINFGLGRVLSCFQEMRDAGQLLAVSVYLPDGTSIASAIFTVEGTELLLWSWAHREEHRWYRATELMTWTVMQRAMAAGCETFDLMGLGDFKMKFGAELDDRKYRWIRSRYRWLGQMRNLAAQGLHWQQAVRGRITRWRSSQMRVTEGARNGHNHGGDQV
jgi:hypothetical protein